MLFVYRFRSEVYWMGPADTHHITHACLDQCPCVSTGFTTCTHYDNIRIASTDPKNIHLNIVASLSWIDTNSSTLKIEAPLFFREVSLGCTWLMSP